MEEFQAMRLVYLLGVLVLVAPALFMIFRDRNVLVRNLAIWMGAAAAAALLFTLLGPP